MPHRRALACTATVFAIVGLVGIGGVGYRIIGGSCPFSCHGCAAGATKTVVRTVAAPAARPPVTCGGDGVACPTKAPGGETRATGQAKPAPVAPATGG